MNDWQKIIVLYSYSIREAMTLINSEGTPFVVIVDEKGTLLGTITDGDIRRGILKGVSIEENVGHVMNKKPKSFHVDTSDLEILKQLNDFEIKYAPIVDKSGKVVGVKFKKELQKKPLRENKVVIMAGGLGSRLGDLTKNFPKPMLKVGGKPILETILKNFENYGFKDISLSVNYKADVIENYFKNGEKFKVSINYLREPKKLGTAGSLTLLNERGEGPLVVMNGDILTTVDFNELLNFHNENNNVATMCIRKYKHKVPYGVVNVDEHNINSIDEKPVHDFFVNAGIYILNPEVIDYIPNDEFFDMTMLFQKLIKQKQKVGGFPLHEYWLDIGQKEDYAKADDDFEDNFK